MEQQQEAPDEIAGFLEKSLSCFVTPTSVIQLNPHLDEEGNERDLKDYLDANSILFDIQIKQRQTSTQKSKVVCSNVTAMFRDRCLYEIVDRKTMAKFLYRIVWKPNETAVIQTLKKHGLFQDGTRHKVSISI